MKFEVAVQVAPSLIVLMVSVDVKQRLNLNSNFIAQELYEIRGGRPGGPVLNSPYGLCGRKATLKPKG